MNFRYTLLSLFFLFIAGVGHAQLIPHYVFSQEATGKYEPLRDSIRLAEGAGLDNQRYPLKLPFVFNFDGEDYENIYVSVNGYVSLGTRDPGTEHWVIVSKTTGIRFISGFGADLMSSQANTSNLSYKVSGSFPNRKLIIQWKDFTFKGVTKFNGNFQIHLSEGSNLIEFLYGPCTLPTGSNVSVQVGLRGLDNTVFHSRKGYSTGWDNTELGNNSSSIIYQAGFNPPIGLKFKFTAPPYCNRPSAISNLLLKPGLNNVQVSFDAGPSTGGGFLIVRTPDSTKLNAVPMDGVAYMTGTNLGNGLVVYAGSSTSFNNTGLTRLTDYTYTVFPYNNGICIGAPLYYTINPLSQTIRTVGPQVYTWLPTSGLSDWTDPLNWSPIRYVPLTQDTLVFNKGGSPVADNVPTSTVRSLIVSENTNITIRSDRSSTLTVDLLLQIDSNATLSLGGKNLKFAYSGAAKTRTNINGTLRILENAQYFATKSDLVLHRGLQLQDSAVFLASNGVIAMNGELIMKGKSSYRASGGTTELNDTVRLYDSAYFNTTDYGSTTIVNVNTTVDNYGPQSEFKSETHNSNPGVNFNEGSVYNHMRDGGSVPLAHFHPTSLARFTGIRNTAPLFSSTPGFGNFVWDCPDQAATIRTSGFGDVTGYCHILNTGAFALEIGNLGGVIIIHGEFKQKNSTVRIRLKFSALGTINFESGVFDIANGSGDVFQVEGNLNQSQSHMIVTTATTKRSVIFAGVETQHVKLLGTIGPGPIDYTLNNPNGVVIEGVIPVREGMSNSILAGNWKGRGGFEYEKGASLVYKGAKKVYCTESEWPEANGPENVVIQQSAKYPENLVYMPQGDRAVQTLSLRGILVLGTSNLTILNPVSSALGVGYPVEENMVVTNASGSLIRTLPKRAIRQNSFLFPIGDFAQVPQHSPVRLTVLNSENERKIGVRVTPQKHPSASDSSNYSKRYWSFTDDGGKSPMGYLAWFTIPQADIIGAHPSMSAWDGKEWFNISTVQTLDGANVVFETPDTVFASAQHFLDGKDFSLQSSKGATYTWTGAIDQEYLEEENWMPARRQRSVNDILQFNSGKADTVANVPTDAIQRLVVSKNTTAILQGGVGEPTLSLYGDPKLQSEGLLVEKGSKLMMNKGKSRLTIRLKGDSCTALINGEIEIFSGSLDNEAHGFQVLDATGIGSKFIIRGKMTNRQRTSLKSFVGIDTNSFLIYGEYVTRLTESGGWLPAARWMDGSVCRIILDSVGPNRTGVGGPSVDRSAANFYKLIYDSPNQNVPFEWKIPSLTVRDSFIINSTGTALLNFLTNYQFDINHFIQRGGIVELGKHFYGHKGGTFSVKGVFDQQAGIIRTPASTNVYPMMRFNGTGGRQLVSFHDQSPEGTIVYKIENADGITLNGTGSLKQDFIIDTNATLIIDGVKAEPIRSQLRLTYLENTTLALEGNQNYLLDDYIFPSVNGPQKLRVAIAKDKIATLPFSRMVNELNMVTGDLNIDTATLTIGESVTRSGRLFYRQGMSGSIRLTTGSVVRWFDPASLPITPDDGGYGYQNIGLFPISSGGDKRHVAMYFTTRSALLSGGTVRVRHDHQNGDTTGLSVSDGGYMIESRSKASWTFEVGDGLAISTGGFGLRLTASGLFPVKVAKELRVMKGDAVAGVHIPGRADTLGLVAERSGVLIGDLVNGPFYIGTAAANQSDIFLSVRSGDWGDAEVWNYKRVPGATDSVLISSWDTVTVNGPANVQSIHVSERATLLFASGETQVEQSIVNEGAIFFRGANLVLGPKGGGNSSFKNMGLMDVSAGRLEINGSLALLRGNDYGSKQYPGIFRQSGAAIVLDGNAGGVLLRSVPRAVPILQIATPNIDAQAGSITIVDPHAFPNEGRLESITVHFQETLANPFGRNHTFTFGDRSSTEKGGNPNGFAVHGLSKFGTLIVNGPSENDRSVYLQARSEIKGDLIIDTGGVLVPNYGISLQLSGDLLVREGGSFSAHATPLTFSSDRSVLLPQRVHGAGVFTTKISGEKFLDITIDNPAGVTFDIGDFSFSGRLTLKEGVLTLTNASTIRERSAGNVTVFTQNNSWVNGRMIRVTPRPNSYELLFPIGNAENYSPVLISAGSWDADIPLAVSGKDGDHPDISKSLIDPKRSFNRYFIVDSLGELNANDLVVRIAVPEKQVDSGASWAQFGIGIVEKDQWRYPKYDALNPRMIQAELASNPYGSYQVGYINALPVITKQPQPYAACKGAVVNFTVEADGAKQYQWQVKSSNGWSDLPNGGYYAGVFSPTLSILSPDSSLHLSEYRCRLANLVGVIFTDSVRLSMSATSEPSVSISYAESDIICVGKKVSFKAVVVNGGTNPTYQWRVNGRNVGGNSSLTTIDGVVDGDVVTCLVTSSLDCAAPSQVLSNDLVLNVRQKVAPFVRITANATEVCAGDRVYFKAEATGVGPNPTFYWKMSWGGSNGTNSDTFSSDNVYAPVTCVVESSDFCPTTPKATSNEIKITTKALVVSSISIRSDAKDTVCPGDRVTFSATAQNGGTNRILQWKKNGKDVGTNSSVYIDSIWTEGDVISCELTSSVECVQQPVVNSQEMTIHVAEGLKPSIHVKHANSGQGPVCEGTPLSFIAVVANGGTSPKYQWKKNGQPVGGNSDTYTDDALGDNDKISCEVIISEADKNCFAQMRATSDTIVPRIIQNIRPSVTLTSLPDRKLCPGELAVFTATATNGGFKPTYRWTQNGVPVGGNDSVFSTTGLTDGDLVTCQVTYEDGCYWAATAIPIEVLVHSTAKPSVVVKASQTMICEGSEVTFLASVSNGGDRLRYQWEKNGQVVGANSANYADKNLKDGDVVNCTVFSEASCNKKDTVLSNKVPISVDQRVVSSVAITASQSPLCVGKPATFTAAAVNPGTLPRYQWLVNGLPVGANASIFTSSSLQDGDIVSCVLKSNAGCVADTVVNSNKITVKMNPLLSPQVSIAAQGSVNVCEGTVMSFEATAVHGGTNPNFQWLVNGIPAAGNNSVFSSASLRNNDVVSCRLISDEPCVSTDTVASNTITVSTYPKVAPTINIQAAGSTSICSGTAVTFNAMITHGGNPVYQWEKNGLPVGKNSASYTDSSLNDGDLIVCILTSDESCVTSSKVESNRILMDVQPTVRPSVTISARPGHVITAGTNVELSAVVLEGGRNTMYQWKKNGVNVGNNSSNYISNSFQDGDQVQLFVRSRALCADPEIVESNIITFQVTTGIESYALDTASLHIFPNPSNGRVVISGDIHRSDVGSCELEILNKLGQRVYRVGDVAVRDGRLNYELSLPAGLANGVYVLTVRLGLSTFKAKIVLER